MLTCCNLSIRKADTASTDAKLTLCILKSLPSGDPESHSEASQVSRTLLSLVTLSP